MSTTELTDGQRNRIALMTIVRCEVARIMRIRGQTLVPPAITMTRTKSPKAWRPRRCT